VAVARGKKNAASRSGRQKRTTIEKNGFGLPRALCSIANRPSAFRVAHSRARKRARCARAWRVRVNACPVSFDDRLFGPYEQNLAREVGDFVVLRADGIFAYQLAVVVDDAAQKITDVVRGADLLDSTPRQIHLQRLLRLPPLRYLHIPIATNEAGEKLSKQTNAPPLGDPLTELEAALRFLNQPMHGNSNATPHELLASAARLWDPSRLIKTGAT
jgi:glutamyl-Q tRNA(Asp) synthetase